MIKMWSNNQEYIDSPYNGIIENNSVIYDNYYLKKFNEWNSVSTIGDYRDYVRKKQKSGIADEFKKDSDFNKLICPYLRKYANTNEKASDSILTLIQAIDNPEKDVIDILVGATLEACGYPSEGSALIGIGILGLISVALFALLASKKS